MCLSDVLVLNGSENSTDVAEPVTCADTEKTALQDGIQLFSILIHFLRNTLLLLMRHRKNKAIWLPMHIAQSDIAPQG